ncbi:MAG: hypothetical protein CHACPFDD_02485 [Phycisphaerae bacterium]|nr:hypothetical protein [Phycisphaerae bacterium]
MLMGAVLCVIFTLLATGTGPTVLYHVESAGDLPGGDRWSVAYDLGADGAICGDSDSAENVHGFVRSADGVVFDVGTLAIPEYPSEACAINDRGEAAGVSMNWNFDDEAFLWSSDTGMVGLGDLPGSEFYSWARGINNRSHVVGISLSSKSGQSGQGYRQEAFLWTPEAGMTGLGDLPGGQFVSSAYDINDSDWVIGWSCSARGCEAFLWTPQNGMIGLGDLTGGPGADSEARGINESGQVVGAAWSPDGYRPFLWDPTDGRMLNLGDFGGEQPAGGANSINDYEQVVGTVRRDSFHPQIPFIWDHEHGLRDLNTLLDAHSRHAFIRLADAVAINNRGQIAGQGIIAPGALLLTPFVLGDMNCDASFDVFDVEPFVLALIDLEAHAAAYPDCHADWAGDINQDGSFNGFDVDPFVELLAGP